MATSQKLTEHFLTCPVCFEVFDKPCTLVCGHSFCGQCVVSYTKTRPDAARAKSLPCPFCERLTKAPDPSKAVEDWPKQLPASLLLRGLLDSFGPGSKDTTNCHSCHEGGETTPASAWCSVCDVALCDACLKFHSRMPLTRHHVVADLSEEVKVRRRPKVMCQEHKDECIKFYCKDCKKTLCQSCCIVYHRKCESVVSLKSMIPQMKKTFEAMRKTLEQKIYSEKKNVKSRKSQCTEIQQAKTSIQTQIRSTAQKAMDAIKKKEKKLMDELDEVTDKQMGQLKADIKTGDMAIQIYRQQSEFIEQALSSDSEMDMYDLYESCETGDVMTEAGVDGKERTKVSNVKLSQNIEKINKAVKELSLGEIKVVGVLDAESTSVLSSTVNCRKVGDNDDPSIYDVMHMDVNGTDTVVITDQNYKSVMSFYTSEKKLCKSRLGLKSKPHRIANVEENKIAVTTSSTEITIISVSPALSNLSSITTSKRYYGLTALTPTTLAAGSFYPLCVDILDRSGAVLKSISPLYNGQEIIINPHFLCTTKKGNILVSDCITKSVVCLTPQGDVVFKYSPTGGSALTSPRGITSTDTGDILVVDYQEHKVIQLSESGQFVRDILTSQDGLRFPYGVDYDESTGSSYVNHQDDSIQVFTFK